MERAKELAREALSASRPLPKRPRAGTQALIAYALRTYVQRHYGNTPPMRLTVTWFDAELVVEFQASWRDPDANDLPF